jgi:peptide/nickel transport system substrate-binding protein
MKQDDPSLPWYDKNVRHAMMMAVNHPALKDDFYGGNAMIVAWPVAPVGDIDLFGDMYTPLEELPESTQKLYGYYPEEAKALLAEAGYPNGFKAELILMEAEADLMSIVKADMAKVGIELDLQVKEVGAYNALAYGREFTNLIQGTIDCTVEFSFWPRLGAGVPQNFGNFNDPIIEEARAEADAAGLDLFAQTRPMKRIFPHILDMAYKLTLTSPYSYIVWHPWVKNYSGTVFNLQLNTYKYWIKYAGVDHDLKN